MEEQTEAPQVKARTLTVVGISPEFNQALLNYLQTKPYLEVSRFIPTLSSLTPFEVTITDGGQGN